MSKLKEGLMTVEQRHAVYVAYLLMKVQECDWHGVSDAANDIRELEASIFVEKPYFK
jgi:hypothetical protein